VVIYPHNQQIPNLIKNNLKKKPINMGVDTKMFIAVKKEAIIDIMPIVINALNKWQRSELDRYADLTCDTYDFGSFNINFTIHGENRQLFITHTCSNDYSDTYKGDKIIFSLGNWGVSEDIMMVVADAIKEKGDLYYVKNDCSDDFKKLELSLDLEKN